MLRGSTVNRPHTYNAMRAEDQGARLSVVAEDIRTGKRVAFINQASPALADVMVGYPRWMVRVGVRATKGDDEIGR